MLPKSKIKRQKYEENNIEWVDGPTGYGEGFQSVSLNVWSGLGQVRSG